MNYFKLNYLNQPINLKQKIYRKKEEASSALSFEILEKLSSCVSTSCVPSLLCVSLFPYESTYEAEGGKSISCSL